MINCFIINDEPFAVSKLEEYVTKTAFLNLKGSATNPLQAIKRIKSHEVNLIFTGVHMNSLGGIELMQVLKSGNYKFILATAYSQ
jgi:response regulator of citrate/malate metabolism